MGSTTRAMASHHKSCRKYDMILDYSYSRQHGNKAVQAARRAKGSNLTDAEQTHVKIQFEEFWDSLPDHDSFEEAYQLWREKKRNKPEQQENEFAAMWGGGCSEAPLTPEELCAYVKEHKFPSMTDVIDADNSEGKAEPSHTNVSFGKDYKLWGTGRSARILALSMNRRMTNNCMTF